MKKITVKGTVLLIACYFLFSFNILKAQVNEVSETVSIAEILSDSRKTFDVDFVYQSDILPADKINFDYTKYKSVESMLEDLLAPYNLKFKKVLAKTYVIYKNKNDLIKLGDIIRKQNGGDLPPEFPDAAKEAKFGSSFLTGTVTDKVSGLVIESVSVKISNTLRGTTTDKNGYFKLNINGDDSSVIFSAIGYDASTVKIGENMMLNVSMISKAQGLNDVVVVGYGTRKRKELTSSISSVSGKEINGLPVADAAQALQGKVSGVIITQGSGAPGGTGGTQIRIRGISSVTGTNNPLIVLDGFPLTDEIDEVNSFLLRVP